MTDETPTSPLGRRRRAPRQEPQRGEHGWSPTKSRPEPKNPPGGKAGASEEPKNNNGHEGDLTELDKGGR